MTHSMRHSMGRVSQIAVALVVFCAVFDAKPSAALEAVKVFRGALVLEGKIEPGDYISVRNFLRIESNFKKISAGVFLASPGGYVIEAMKIGNLIRALQLGTDAPSVPPPEIRKGNPIIRGSDLVNAKHYECVSACFLIYAAGVDRKLIWAGRLGLHQPRSLRADSSEVTAASVSVRNAIKEYLVRMNVPEKYVGLMYSLPPNEVRWVTQQEFEKDLKGYVPELSAAVDEKCKAHDAAEHLAEMRRCAATVREALSDAAWRVLFKRDH